MKISIVCALATCILISVILIIQNYKTSITTVISKKTTIQLPETIIDLNLIPLDSIWNGEINIKNIGANNFIIYNINTSCGCVAVSIPNKIVPPDSICLIQIKVSPQTEGIFVQRIGIMCNIENSPLVFSIKGKIIK